ncbi:leucine efflux protein LeuE [Leucothrix sargassi]|nr:leucine efflux protein LeuE [Leucothrix sargassi]
MESYGVINYMTYIIGTILIVLLPGPNSLYVLAISAQKGVRYGWSAACGVFVGDSILMFATAAGAVTLLNNYPVLFQIVQYAGAAYLSYIGFRLMQAAWKSWQLRHELPDAIQMEVQKDVSRGEPFTKALIVSLLNPKAILFFISFFVQFVNPSYAQPAVPFLILALTLQFFSAIYLGMVIYGGSYLADSFRKRRRLTAATSAATGTAFMGFAVKLATATMAS